MRRFKILGPRGGLVGRGTAATVGRALPKLISKFKSVKIVTNTSAPAKPKRPFTMFDSIHISQIPTKAAAVAGYVGGHWPTFAKLSKRYRKSLSIAVNASENARCLDIENGDATPAEAPAWMHRQFARGEKHPVVYASVSEMPAVIYELARNGIKRSSYFVWTAHYTGKAHRCDQRCYATFHDVADATQYTDHANGANLDASLCRPDFI